MYSNAVKLRFNSKSGETAKPSSRETFTVSKTSKSSAATNKPSSTGPNSKDNLDKLWYENLERLKPCIVNGKMDYSGLTDEKGKKQLSDFVYRQRQYFRMRENIEESPLTNERFEALSAANFPFEVQKSKSLIGLKSSSKKDVIVSLKDPSYKQIMEEYFKKLGPKTYQTEEGKLTEREAADGVFNKLKNKGGRFVRLTNPHNLNEGYAEIDEDEAWNSKYLVFELRQVLLCAYHTISFQFCRLSVYFYGPKRSAVTLTEEWNQQSGGYIQRVAAGLAALSRNN